MRRTVLFSLFLALPLAAVPLAAAEPGEPYLVRDIDLTGEPYYEECHITCVPPTPVFGSLIEQLTPLGDLVVFVANDRVHGFEPWVSDGTAEGTRLLADTCMGACSDLSPTIVGALGDRLYFAAVTEPGEPILWVTDGTPEGTQALPELCPELCSGSIFDPTVVYEGSLFFTVYETSGGHSGRHLWRTDGTPAGTERIQPVCTRSTGCYESFASFFEYGGYLFYADWTNLLRLDGPGAEPEVAWSVEPLDAAVLGDRAILAVGGSLPSLWVLEHPLAEPELLTHISGAWLSELTAAGGFVYFVRHEGAVGTLWRTDGTPGGTGPVVPEVSGYDVEIVGLLDGDPVVTVRPEPSPLPVVLPTLWRIGSTKGSEALSQLPVQAVAVVGDRIFFSADDEGLLGRELWVSDGTAGETRLLADIAPGAPSSDPGHGGRYEVGFAAADDLLFFPAFQPDLGVELWALDLGAEDEPPLPPPPPPSTEWLESPEVPGYRVQVRISGGSSQILGREEPACIPETLCVSGAVTGRSEVFVRVVGPKPNGFLWPTLVKFSTSTVEVWIEQESTGTVRYYLLEGASPGVDVLPGLFDRTGFLP